MQSNKEIAKFVGGKIKEYRTARNITQQELAEQLSTTSQTISRYESGILEINQESLYKLAEFFKIIGDTTRSKILFALDKNEMCVCDIANVLGMSKSSISHQLGTLRRSGIVKCRKEGKEVFYVLDDEHVQEVFEVGLEHIEHKK